VEGFGCCVVNLFCNGRKWKRVTNREVQGNKRTNEEATGMDESMDEKMEGRKNENIE